MGRSHLHRLLLWAGPGVILFVGSCIGLIAALAQSFPRVQIWAGKQFDQWWPIVSAGWFLVSAAVVICVYIAAVVWTGWTSSKPTFEVPFKGTYAMPLPFVIRYMGHGSRWSVTQPDMPPEQWHCLAVAELREQLRRGDLEPPRDRRRRFGLSYAAMGTSSSMS